MRGAQEGRVKFEGCGLGYLFCVVCMCVCGCDSVGGYCLLACVLGVTVSKFAMCACSLSSMLLPRWDIIV